MITRGGGANWVEEKGNCIEGGQKLKTSNYKINKCLGCNVRQD